MKWLLIAVAVLAVIIVGVGHAQNPGQIIITATTPVGACGNTQMRLLTPNGTIYTCQNGVWGVATGGGGGSAVAPYTLCASGCNAVVGPSPTTYLNSTTKQGPGATAECFDSSGNQFGVGVLNSGTALVAGDLTISYQGTTPDHCLIYTPSGAGTTTVYPGAGVANSTGSAWGTSYTVGTAANNLVQLTAADKLPAVDGSLLTNLPGVASYPGAGVPNSTGSAWTTSYTVGVSANNLLQLNGSSQIPAVSAVLLTNLPVILTTTGTSGAATYTQSTNTLNIPQYTGGISGLTVGTTTISGGTNGSVEFNNSGVLGEIATTGSGNIARATGPTFIAPVLGTPASGNATNLSNLPIILTTSGSSGAASYTQATNTLNIPIYSGTGGFPITSPTGTINTTNCTSGPTCQIDIAQPANFLGSPVTFTAGSGVTSVTCISTSCDVNGGTITVVGGTATTGTIATVNYSSISPAPRSCQVTMDGGATSYGMGHGIPGTTTFTITAAVSVIGATFSVDYQCKP